MSDLQSVQQPDQAPARKLSNAEMAAALINTRFLPSGLQTIRDYADEADAYHAQRPYPRFAYANWKKEELGPLPKCLPLAKEIVKRGAKWLFGKPIQIKCAGNAKLEKTLLDAWTQNKMGSRMVPAAEKAARHGGLFLKYAVDESNVERAITIQTLSVVDEVRLFYHPHDRNMLLMVRIQYPYYDASTGLYWWYREEWTAQEEVHYEPVKDDVFRGTNKINPDLYDGWKISSRETNPFGRIPGQHIKNLETDDSWGAGDLWSMDDENGLFRTLDEVNLTWWLMGLSNQYDSRINPIFVDADLDDQDIDKPLQPGQPIDIKSTEGQHPARVLFPTGQNQLRPAMMEYSKELRRMVHNTASSVELDPKEFTNKGNLTEAVLELIFQVQIEITDEKHKSYGENGIELFLENLAQGAQAAGMDLGVTSDKKSYDVQLAWAPYFGLSEDEKQARVGRIQQEERAGYTTHERAIEAVAQIEDVNDVQELKDELAKLPPPVPPAVPLPDEQSAMPGAKATLQRPV